MRIVETHHKRRARMSPEDLRLRGRARAAASNNRTMTTVLRRRDKESVDAIAESIDVPRSSLMRAFILDGLQRWAVEGQAYRDRVGMLLAGSPLSD